jgi:SAM-dependent methyltransferase
MHEPAAATPDHHETDRHRERLATFDRIAEHYATARPGYPDAVFDTLERVTSVAHGSRVLEVGAGPGQATIPLAARGYRVTALEPGARLAAVARERLRAVPGADAQVLEQRLEDWRVEPAAFDLVLAASAWHWVDATVGLEIAHRALRPDGWIALLWNVIVNGPGSDRLRVAIEPAYLRWAPSLADEWTHVPEPDAADGDGDDLATTPIFRDQSVHRLPWTQHATTAAYLNFIGTFSDHNVLPADVREHLFAAIGDAIDTDLGGEVVLDRISVLKLGRRAP